MTYEHVGMYWKGMLIISKKKNVSLSLFRKMGTMIKTITFNGNSQCANHFTSFIPFNLYDNPAEWARSFSVYEELENESRSITCPNPLLANCGMENCIYAYFILNS